MPQATAPALGADAASAYGTAAAYPPAYSAATTGLPVTVERSKPTWYTVGVGLLRFNTAVIPDTAVVESAVLQAQIVRVQNVDSRQLSADWYDFAGTVDSGDWTATAGIDAYAGIPISSLPAEATSSQIYVPLLTASGEAGVLSRFVYTSSTIPITSLTLLLAAANVNLTGYTGVRFHISGAAPTGQNIVKIHNPQLVVTYAEPAQAGGSDPQTGGSSATVVTVPFVQPTASRRKPRLEIPWQLVLSERSTKPISVISRVAIDKQLSFRRSKPASCSFKVPASDVELGRTHTDGLPVLHPLARTVQAYRWEQNDSGDSAWKLRFSGVITQLEDAGDVDEAWTSVACFDPWVRLGSRFVTLPEFAEIDGASIARQLVDAANAVDYTGVMTRSGTFETSPKRTRLYDGKISVGAALVELADAFNGFDIWLEPYTALDSFGNPVYDGTLVRMHAFTKLGRWQDRLKFSWGAPPHNVRSVSRLLDGAATANHITGLGQSSQAGPLFDQDSIARYGRSEGISTYSDLVSAELLEALVAEELSFRHEPRELVHIVPQTGLAPEPFTHVNVGDLFEVYVGTRLRGGFAGLQRLYGFDISLTDELAIESVDRFITTPGEA